MDAAEMWDAQAPDMDAAMFAAWANPGDGLDSCLPRLRSVIQREGPIGEIGCGPGRLLLPVAEMRGPERLHGVDVSPRMLDWCRVHLGVLAEQVTLDVVDGSGELPWSEFGGIWSVLTFQHMPHEAQSAYIRSAGAALVDGGCLVIQFVPEGDVGPLNFPTPVATIVGWARDAGFDPFVSSDETFETWQWLTATRKGTR